MCIQSSYTNAQWIYINNLNNYFWYVVVILLYICCCFLLLACSSSLYTELSFFISSLFCCMCSLIMFIVNIIHTFGAECVCIFCFFVSFVHTPNCYSAFVHSEIKIVHYKQQILEKPRFETQTVQFSWIIYILLLNDLQKHEKFLFLLRTLCTNWK